MRVFLVSILFFSGVIRSALISAGDVEDESRVIPVYVDLETTGLSMANCEILQIAAKTGDKEFDQYILPQGDIERDASLVNHLTKRGGELYYRGQRVTTTGLKDALTSFIEFLKDVAAPKNRLVLVAHFGNGFDYPIILRDMKRHALLESFLEVVASSIDSKDVLKAELPGRRSYRLAALAYHYGIKTDEAHNAMADVRILAEVTQKAGISDSKLESYAQKLSDVAFPE